MFTAAKRKRAIFIQFLSVFSAILHIFHKLKEIQAEFSLILLLFRQLLTGRASGKGEFFVLFSDSSPFQAAPYRQDAQLRRNFGMSLTIFSVVACTTWPPAPEKEKNETLTTILLPFGSSAPVSYTACTIPHMMRNWANTYVIITPTSMKEPTSRLKTVIARMESDATNSTLPRKV